MEIWIQVLLVLEDEVKSMSLEENKAIVSRFVEEVQNNHNLDAVNELFDRNMVDHLGQPVLSAAEGFKKFYSGLLAAFPDLRCVVHSQVAEGDKVATHKTFHGTHKGEFMGMPPTGKKIAVDVIDIFRIAGGKMVEHWAVQDLAGLMRQLGVKPPPA
jgi:steroid delta-isomerase-like uncharacterized protein